KEGTIRSEGNKAGDVRTIGEAAGAGAGVGSIAGAINHTPGMGAGIGAAAGATAGLIGVLGSRGPEAVLAKGTTMEMVPARPVQFNEAELDFSNAIARRGTSDGPGPLPSKKTQTTNSRRWPL